MTIPAILPKITYKLYFVAGGNIKDMKKNKFNIFLFVAVLVAFTNLRLGCKEETIVEPGFVEIKFFFVNQTQDTVLLYQGGCFNYPNLPRDSSTVLLPNDTLILYRHARGFSDIEANATAFGSGSCFVQYGLAGDKCDYGSDFRSGTFSDLKYYEIRNQISPGNFELTYFFTEAKKEKAGSCIF